MPVDRLNPYASPFGASPFTDATINTPPPGTTSQADFLTPQTDALQISFSRDVLAEPVLMPIPPGPALSLAEARAINDTRAAAMAPDERASVLVGISRGIATGGDKKLLTREAIRVLRAVLERGALEATFNRLIATRELGFVVDQLGLSALVSLSNDYDVDFNAIAARSDTVRERGMTRTEREYSRRIFGGGVDYDAVRFRFTRGTTTSGAEALVLGNTVNVDPSTTRFTFEPGTTIPNEAGLREWQNTVLIHELTHVWQYQHVGSQYALQSLMQQVISIVQTGDRGAPYKYQLKDHRSFGDFGVEQQAMILQDYDTYLYEEEHGGTVPGVLAAYRPYIDQMRAMGPGNGGDGGAQAVAMMLPDLTQKLGGDAVRDLLTGKDWKGAAVIAGAAALSYHRGSVILEELGVPNAIRIGNRHAGVSLGGRYERGFKNGAATLGFDARGRVGDLSVAGDARATVNANGVESATLRLSARGDELSIDAGVRHDRTGTLAAYRLRSGGFFSDGSLRIETRDYEVRAGCSNDDFAVSGAVKGDRLGLSDARLSASVGSAIAANVHLGKDGVFSDATLAGAIPFGGGLSLDGAGTFDAEGVRSVRGGVTVRGNDGFASARILYTPRTDTLAGELTGRRGTLEGFARISVTGDRRDATFGLSGNF